MVGLLFLYGMVIVVVSLTMMLTEGVKAGVRSGTKKLKRTKKGA